MGVEQTKPNNSQCEVSLNLDSSICFAGDVLKGSVLLKPKKKFNIKTINLSMDQIELWSWNKGKKKKTSTVPLLKTSINVDGSVQPGQARFPFSFQIPTYANSSFEYPLMDKSAYIRTYLQATIPELSLTVQILVLIKSAAKILDSPLTLTKTIAPKIMFFDAGATVLTASYPANNFSFFNQIPIIISIDSTKSKIGIKSCTVTLLRNVKFLEHGKEDKQLIIEDKLNESKKTITSKEMKFTEVFSLNDPETLFNTYAYTCDGISFPDKKQLIRFMPSCRTGFIACEYYIKIVAEYDTPVSIPLIDKPTLILPLSVTHYASGDVANSMVVMGQELEQNWNMQNQPGIMASSIMMSQMAGQNMMMSQIPGQNMMMPPQQNMIMSQIPGQNMMMPPQQNMMMPQMPNQQQGMMPPQQNHQGMVPPQYPSYPNQFNNTPQNNDNAPIDNINNYPNVDDAPPIQPQNDYNQEQIEKPSNNYPSFS